MGWTHKMVFSAWVLTCSLFFMTGTSSAFVFKIATVSPDGTAWMQKMRQGAERIEKETGGAVEIKFYPGGVMGDDNAVLRKIRIGQLHGGAVTAGSWSDVYSDKIVYELPLKFKSLDEVDFVRKKMDSILAQRFEEKGFVTFGFAEGGFAYVLSKNPLASVEEMRTQKVWIPEGDAMSLEIVKAFEITPIALPIAEVRTGLQTGLINTVACSPIGALALQWHTQVNYITDVPLFYLYAYLAIDAKAFAKISPEHQEIMRKEMGAVFKDINDQNRRDNADAMAALEKQGIRHVATSPEALAKFRELADHVPERMVQNGSLSQEIVDMLNKNLSEYSK